MSTSQSAQPVVALGGVPPRWRARGEPDADRRSASGMRVMVCGRWLVTGGELVNAHRRGRQGGLSGAIVAQVRCGRPAAWRSPSTPGQTNRHRSAESVGMGLRGGWRRARGRCANPTKTVRVGCHLRAGANRFSGGRNETRGRQMTLPDWVRRLDLAPHPGRLVPGDLAQRPGAGRVGAAARLHRAAQPGHRDPVRPDGRPAVGLAHRAQRGIVAAPSGQPAAARVRAREGQRHNRVLGPDVLAGQHPNWWCPRLLAAGAAARRRARTGELCRGARLRLRRLHPRGQRRRRGSGAARAQR